MLIRAFAVVLLAVGAFPAAALDLTDQGVYAVVHRDGHVTSKHIRLMRIGEEWIAKDADDQSQAENCPVCVLKPSTSAEVEQFMGGPAPAGMAAECAHNNFMAICRITEGQAPEVSRQYGFVALTQSRPVYLKLVRVPAGAP